MSTQYSFPEQPVREVDVIFSFFFFFFCFNVDRHAFWSEGAHLGRKFQLTIIDLLQLECTRLRGSGFPRLFFCVFILSKRWAYCNASKNSSRWLRHTTGKDEQRKKTTATKQKEEEITFGLFAGSHFGPLVAVNANIEQQTSANWWQRGTGKRRHTVWRGVACNVMQRAVRTRKQDLSLGPVT